MKLQRMLWAGVVLVTLGFVIAMVARPQSARKIGVLGLRVAVAAVVMWGALRVTQATRRSRPTSADDS